LTNVSACGILLFCPIQKVGKVRCLIATLSRFREDVDRSVTDCAAPSTQPGAQPVEAPMDRPGLLGTPSARETLLAGIAGAQPPGVSRIPPPLPKKEWRNF